MGGGIVVVVVLLNIVVVMLLVAVAALIDLFVFMFSLVVSKGSINCDCYSDGTVVWCGGSSSWVLLVVGNDVVGGFR